MNKGLNIAELVLGAVTIALGAAVMVISIIGLNQSDGSIKF